MCIWDKHAPILAPDAYLMGTPSKDSYKWWYLALAHMDGIAGSRECNRWGLSTCKRSKPLHGAHSLALLSCFCYELLYRPAPTCVLCVLACEGCEDQEKHGQQQQQQQQGLAAADGVDMTRPCPSPLKSNPSSHGVAQVSQHEGAHNIAGDQQKHSTVSHAQSQGQPQQQQQRQELPQHGLPQAAPLPGQEAGSGSE
eukprot:scaffold64645_cov20-Tisochrysis_lutea.AAC.1